MVSSAAAQRGGAGPHSAGSYAAAAQQGRSNANAAVAAAQPLGLDHTELARLHELERADDPEARRAELIAEYKERFANPYHAAERGYVDEVIEPRLTRPVLISALEVAKTKREPRPKRKHGNIPL